MPEPRYYLTKPTAEWIKRAKERDRDLTLAGRNAGRSTPPVSAIVVKVTSPAAGGGKYVGTVYLAPTADIPASGNLTAASLGSDGADALIVNPAEAGTTGHTLTAGVYVGRLVRINSDGTPVVAISSGGSSGLPTAYAEGQVVLANSAKAWIASFPKLHPDSP